MVPDIPACKIKFSGWGVGVPSLEGVRTPRGGVGLAKWGIENIFLNSNKSLGYN